jgi:hypothetical protein
MHIPAVIVEERSFKTTAIKRGTLLIIFLTKHVHIVLYTYCIIIVIHPYVLHSAN